MCYSPLIVRTISFAAAASTNNVLHPPVPIELPIEDFVSRFSVFGIAPKHETPLWVPARFKTLTRRADAVSHITAFVVDCDSWTQTRLDREVRKHRDAGRHFLVHSSPSYAPPERAKARFIFFLDEDIEVGTPWRWRDAMWPTLMHYLDFDPSGADQQCKNADRVYYVPSRPTAEAPHFSHYYPGADLPTRIVLAPVYAMPVVDFDYRRTYESREDPATLVRTDELALRLVTRFPRGSVGAAIEQVLAGKAPEDGAPRHEVLKLFTWALAHVAKDEEASENLLPVVRPFCDALESKYGHRGTESWYREATRLLVGARANKPSWDARYEARKNFEKKILSSFDANCGE